MKKYFIFLFLLTLSLVSIAQDSHVYVKGYVDNEKNERLMGCAIQVFQDDRLIRIDTTGPSGMYKFDSLYVGHVYDIFFEKDGYVVKFARIDVKEANRDDLVRFPIELNMALFSDTGSRPEKFYFLQSEPYVMAKYNKETSVVEWDLEYLKKMQEKVNSLR